MLEPPTRLLSSGIPPIVSAPLLPVISTPVLRQTPLLIDHLEEGQVISLHFLKTERRPPTLLLVTLAPHRCPEIVSTARCSQTASPRRT